MVCSFPLLRLEDGCIWWHLPLAAIAFVSLAVLLSMLARRLVDRRRKILDTAERQLYEDMWSDPAHAGKRYKALRQRLGLPNSNIDRKLADVLCLQSHRAGVGMSYLLSDGFADLATKRTGKNEPTFNDMKELCRALLCFCGLLISSCSVFFLFLFPSPPFRIAV